MGLVFPSHILASVFISLQFSFHPLSKTNQNNPSIRKISLQSDGAIGSDASPESQGVDFGAQNWVPLAKGPPQLGKRVGPQHRHPKPERRGPFTAADVGHLSTQLSL